MPGDLPRYRSNADEFAWFAFAGGCALYHRPSGKTHFVNESARLLLMQVLARPAAVGEAASTLARLQDPQAASTLDAEVAALIHRFEELGLVRRC